jgi:transcription initiation factor IIE alpha subunit
MYGDATGGDNVEEKNVLRNISVQCPDCGNELVVVFGNHKVLSLAEFQKRIKTLVEKQKEEESTRAFSR